MKKFSGQQKVGKTLLIFSSRKKTCSQSKKGYTEKLRSLKCLEWISEIEDQRVSKSA